MTPPRKSDMRKGYPTGTRGSVGIEVSSYEPHTKARGKQFAKIIGDTMKEARDTVEQRLLDAGYRELSVTIDLDKTDLGYWWDARIVSDYESRNPRDE